MHLHAVDLTKPHDLRDAPGLPTGPVSAPPPVPAPAKDIAVPPRRMRRTVRLGMTAAALAAVWAVLLPGDAASWWIGAPAIVIGAGFTLFMPAAPLMRLSLWGLLRFATVFTVQSVIGAVDVARRALALRPAIDPGFVTVRTRLPAGPARVLLANAITLLPGTLTAGMEDDRLLVHAIDATADPEAEVRMLEALIAAMFRLDIGDT